MSDRTLKIRPGSAQPDAVQIDDEDFGDAVSGVYLMLKPGKLPQVHLDLNVYVTPVELEDPIVVVPEQTRRALEALGWKSPGDAMVFETVVRTMVAEEIAAEERDPNSDYERGLIVAEKIARREATR